MEAQSMVERVARSIYEKRNGAGCRPWTRQNAAYQALYLEEARAAIESMRYPTQEMMNAGDGCCGEYGCGDYRMAQIFTAMIDVALNENGEKG